MNGISGNSTIAAFTGLHEPLLWDKSLFVLTHLEKGLPNEIMPNFTIGITLLSSAIFSLTYPASVVASTIRGFLATMALIAFWNMWTTPHTIYSVVVEIGVGWAYVYMTMRCLEVLLYSSVEPTPLWVVNGKTQPLPTTLKERLMWTVDLLATARGTSLFYNTHWNYCSPRHLQGEKTTRASFLKDRLRTYLLLYLVYDAIDTFHKSQSWYRTGTKDPVTSLPFHLQIIFAFSVCLGTIVSVEKPLAFNSILGVAMGLPPQGFPLFFDHPLSATSLSDFWTYRWHTLFQQPTRVFTRAVFEGFGSIFNEDHRRIRQLIKGFLVFGVVCVGHFAIMYRVNPVGEVAGRPNRFFEPGTLKFFCRTTSGNVHRGGGREADIGKIIQA